MNKRLYKFSEFLNEKKEEKSKDSIKKEIEKDAKKVATEMFDKTRNVQFDYKGDVPKSITFEVTETDYNLDYNDILSMEYSENVLKKRAYKVELKFASKKTEKVSKSSNKYIMKFNIKLTKSDKVKFDVESDYYLVWEFDEKPTEVIKAIKKNEKCIWDPPLLKITKSSWDKIATTEVSRLIDKAEGIKRRNEKI